MGVGWVELSLTFCRAAAAVDEGYAQDYHVERVGTGFLPSGFLPWKSSAWGAWAVRRDGNGNGRLDLEFVWFSGFLIMGCSCLSTVQGGSLGVTIQTRSNGTFFSNCQPGEDIPVSRASHVDTVLAM